MSVSRESVELSCALFAKYVVDHASLTLVYGVIQYLVHGLGNTETHSKHGYTLNIPPYFQS